MLPQSFEITDTARAERNNQENFANFILVEGNISEGNSPKIATKLSPLLSRKQSNTNWSSLILVRSKKFVGNNLESRTKPGCFCVSHWRVINRLPTVTASFEFRSTRGTKYNITKLRTIKEKKITNFSANFSNNDVDFFPHVIYVCWLVL